MLYLKTPKTSLSNYTPLPKNHNKENDNNNNKETKRSGYRKYVGEDNFLRQIQQLPWP